MLFGFLIMVKPGITGWAQVNYGYAGSTQGQEEKFQFDLFYLENRSVRLDLWILLATLRTVARRCGV